MGDHEAHEESVLHRLLHGDDEPHPDDLPKLTDEEWAYILAIHGEGSD